MRDEGVNPAGEIPERFDPVSMRGDLVEAEHLVRYRWASALARGKRVLDAGCGLGYGSRMLAEGGATAVNGIDVDEPTIAEANRRIDDAAVSFQIGDVRDLRFEDGSFDLVVCFEVIEHLEDRERALGEFERVLAPEGLLVISSPNREAYVAGNPHHVHEYEPEELKSALEQRFAHVRLARQHDWILSAILDDAAFESEDGAVIERFEVAKLVGRRPGEETYTLAVAGDRPFPDLDLVGLLTSPVELQRWVALYEEQHQALDRQHAGLSSAVTERDRARTERDQARAERDWARTERDAAMALVNGIEESLSWRATAPLRALKRRLRG